MQVEDYIRFLRESGEKITEIEGDYYLELRKNFYESIPPHRVVKSNKKPRNSIGVRYTTDQGNVVNNEFICDVDSYNLNTLHSKARNQTRRGLENCEVREITIEDVRERGLEINRSVLGRQGRMGPEKLSSLEGWNEYLEIIKKYDDIQVFGAFVEGKLCAYTLVIKLENYAYLYHPMSDSAYLKYYPMNALIYTVTQNYLDSHPNGFISYGLESLKGLKSLNTFKERMGYRRREIKRNVNLNPLINVALKMPGTKPTIKYLSKKSMKFKEINNFLGMIEGKS
ncbi:GNAT family N-acetyltransferase [Bacillus mobilis]|uniref:GNAT family N-acetyltransferase n=1 Tax=Bacillus mobilis TaxID=2026190 RepID=UPI000A30140D|nr:GNAT family N-acetyltransferase [Bacillus mobilis]MCU5594426.1 GNAT family N-acetyltransferase [Bacillus mobilis]MCU5739488.1 GNAT family N-acetyltransferase [Bacillus mobilis]MCU9558183.1 GNAT family N-acetyltransferase [Bacillus mobilis]SMD72980.1 hypothetical protein BACERE00177_00211 [Bacillus mobilis]HDR7514042.1 hypothetical protein [Bacillus mobilis]